MGIRSPTVLLIRARLLASLGDVEAAIADADEAFSARPRLTGALRTLVSLYTSRGEIALAIESFERLRELGTLSPGHHILLGRLHLMRGDDERARDVFEKALRAGSDLPALKNDLAFLIAKSDGDLTRAMELAQAAVSEMPDEPNAADTLGFVYLKSGLHAAALQQFDVAVALADMAPSLVNVDRESIVPSISTPVAVAVTPVAVAKTMPVSALVTVALFRLPVSMPTAPA